MSVDRICIRPPQTMVHFDFETAGLTPAHPSIQLAAIAVTDDQEVGSFEQKISFDVSQADHEALAMNHYTAEEWAEACLPGVASARFAAWLRPYCTEPRVSKGGNPYSVALLAGYNALTFDYPRLRQLFGTQFLPCDVRVRDVLQRALFWFDEHPDAPKPANYKLATVASAFGLETDGAHDALADCRLAWSVARAMREAW